MDDILNSYIKAREKIKESLSKVIIGYSDIIDLMISSLIANGHCLLIGVPGLAKTLLVKSIAQVFDLKFKRIQFTPDLMPGDITGSEILEEDKETGRRNFRFVPGPIFGNIILADEINRTPPKTQAALLEGMQEKRVTFSGKSFELDKPFIVFATQNPIEHQGTYPLPEAQLDRFMMAIDLTYPSEEDELEIIKKKDLIEEPDLLPVISRNELKDLQKGVEEIPVAPHVYKYALSIVRGSRPQTPAIDEVKEYVSWGAGPRAAQHLILATKSWALWNGKPTPSIEDIKIVAPFVLSHRIVLNFQAEAEGISQRQIINKIIEKVKEL